MKRTQQQPGARGVVLVEFAICLAGFVLISLSILGWGMALKQNQMLRECARCAARAAALAPSGTSSANVTQRIVDTYNQFLVNSQALPGDYELTVIPGWAGPSTTVEIRIRRSSAAAPSAWIAGLFGVEGRNTTALVGTNAANAYP